MSDELETMDELSNRRLWPVLSETGGPVGWISFDGRAWYAHTEKRVTQDAPSFERAGKAMGWLLERGDRDQAHHYLSEDLSGEAAIDALRRIVREEFESIERSLVDGDGGDGELVSLLDLGDTETRDANAAIRAWWADVCALAEHKMLATGKLEGAHYAAAMELLPREEDDGE